jgi:hypothetical protein
MTANDPTDVTITLTHLEAYNLRTLAFHMDGYKAPEQILEQAWHAKDSLLSVARKIGDAWEAEHLRSVSR